MEDAEELHAEAEEGEEFPADEDKEEAEEEEETAF